MAFTVDTAPDFIPPYFTVPREARGGTTSILRVGFHPTVLGAATGTLRITTSDPAHAVVDIPLHGTGGTALTAVARMDSVNGQAPASMPAAVQPLDNVVVTGADSVAANPTHHITSYQWTWTAKPTASTASLSTPNAMTTGFTFNSSNVTRPGLDVAGTYVLGLTVTDDAGISSTNPAQVTINAVFLSGLSVQLTWEDAI